MFKLFIFSLFSYIYSQCPPQYSLCSGVCVYKSTAYMTYFGAWQICESLRGRLTLSNELNVLKTCGSTTEGSWIGMTDLLYNRYLNRTGWLWSDGSITDNTSPWKNTEPDLATHNCGSSLLSEIGSSPCDMTFPFICFYQNSTLRQNMFFTKSPTIFYDTPQLGYQNVTVEGGRISCAIKCNNTPYCKSYYYEDRKKQCVITKYVDSALPQNWINDSYNWERFN